MLTEISFDALLHFKTLVLKSLLNFSVEELDFHIRNRCGYTVF